MQTKELWEKVAIKHFKELSNRNKDTLAQIHLTAKEYALLKEEL